MTSFHAEKCCRLVRAHAASAGRLCDRKDIQSVKLLLRNLLGYCHGALVQPEVRCGMKSFSLQTDDWIRMIRMTGDSESRGQPAKPDLPGKSPLTALKWYVWLHFAQR